MTTVEPISECSMAFRAKIPNKIKNISSKEVSADKIISFMERTSGFNYAIMHHKNPQEIQETVLRETMLGNLDYVAGINEALAKSAAKNGYKS